MFKPFYIKLIIQGWWNWFLDCISDLKYKKYFDDRLNICKNCEHNIKYMGARICDQCGCIIKSKASIESEKCLMNKW